VTKRVVAAVFVLILAAMAGLAVGCGGGLPKDALAQVGSVYITQKQFDTRLADFEAQYAGQFPDKAKDPTGYKTWQQQVLDYMVTYEIVTQKAQSLSISVSDAEVQKEIDSIVTSSFSGDQTKFDAALKAQNMTLDQLKLNYKESMLLQKAYDQVTKDITTVPDADISAYYDAHKSDYFTAETRTARHILISPTADRPTTTTSSTTSTTAGTATTTASDSTTTSSESTTTTLPPTDAEWATALAKAQKVRADLVGGADWKTEAAQYSNDTGTKDSGGDLGTISKGEMVAEFETSVFSLKLNEISQPVKTIYGYHVIQVTGITAAKQSTLAEVKTDINTTLVNTKKSAAWQAWIAKTKAEIKVVYKDGMELTTTTTVAGTATTTAGSTETTVAGADDTSTTVGGATSTTTAASDTTTTAAPATTTTAAPATTTTAAPATTTTVK
jgi:foldase protein PrsA